MKITCLSKVSRFRRAGKNGFTLVELMMVITIIAASAALVTPALNSLGGSGRFSQSAYQISGSLELARFYAMANNTYVYAAVAERDASNMQQTGVGRVLFVLMASKDGTRGYDINSPAQLDVAKLTPISAPIILQGIHMVVSNQLSNKGGLQTRPKLDSGSCDLGATNSATPLIRTVNGPSYTFSKVIQFDPQGVARVQTPSNGDTVPTWIELGLKEAPWYYHSRKCAGRGYTDFRSERERESLPPLISNG